MKNAIDSPLLDGDVYESPDPETPNVRVYHAIFRDVGWQRQGIGQPTVIVPDLITINLGAMTGFAYLKMLEAAHEGGFFLFESMAYPAASLIRIDVIDP